MTIEIILLALASTVRPTSLAAVYALLAADEPRRLMTVYVLAGLAFTLAFGLLVIWVFSGVPVSTGTDQAKGIAEIIGGLAMLAFAIGVSTGRVGGRHADDAPKAPSRWHGLLERQLTPRTAAIAGPATHVPGLFYLVALNVIVAHHLNPFDGLAEVVIYNLIWFAIPILALAACIFRPDVAREGVGAISDWTRRNSRRIVIIVSFVVGAALVVRGILGLQS
ncbi:MAG TPA: GAP family protein [Solirubrobacteraceae bacterium]|nr:GAP family protein [Solirubrobacteraceae bacterium]